MNRSKFPLTSDQLELLLSFETNGSLSALSQNLGKDPSVISRNLQRMSEAMPVVVKQQGRWQITAFGQEVNSLTRKFLHEFEAKLPKSSASPTRALEPCLSEKALLMIVNAQVALLDPGFG